MSDDMNPVVGVCDHCNYPLHWEESLYVNHSDDLDEVYRIHKECYDEFKENLGE